MKKKQNTSYGNTKPIKPLWGFNYVDPYFCNLVSIEKLMNGQQAIYLIFKYILQKFTCKLIILVFSDVLNDTTNVKKETDSHIKKNHFRK